MTINTDARGCCVVGHPEYYKQFGFVNNLTELMHEGVPPEVFFDRPMPKGTIALHEAFQSHGE